MTWDGYRIHRQREVIDRTLRKVLFKESEGKPYELAVNIIGDLIQFYSIAYRFIIKNPLEFGEFISNFSAVKQIAKGFESIRSFVLTFDDTLPLLKFGVSDE